jgi:hypothetical protein
MSEEQLKHRHEPEESFEQQDMSPNAVYAFLGGLAVAGILVYFVLWGFYHALDAYQKRHQPPQNPLVQQTAADTRNVSPEEIKQFPQPRLERDERGEINDFRLHEEQTLNSYGWVDQKAGVVRIPIDRAMQLIAQQGLPTTPKTGTVPPSEVNVVGQAAERADTSNLGKGKAKK